MRRFLQIILVIFALAGLQPAVKADHIVGSDITYRCVNDSTYYFVLKFYRDCNGCYVLSQPNPCGTTENCASSATAPTSLSVTGVGGSCNGTAFANLSMSRQSIVDITPTCKSVRSRCQQPCGSSYPYGIEEHTFTGTLNVASIKASGCCRIRISVTLSVRSAIITTGQQQQTFFTYAEVDLCASPCNNSPALTNKPIAIVCCNQPYFFNNGAVDSLDYDSLSYHMVPPMTSSSANANFASGLSTTTPVPVYLPGPCNQLVPNANPPIGFFLDSLTGDLIFTPASNNCTPVGCPWVGIVCMEMREWRMVNGNMTIVGRTRRDMQFIAQTCPGNFPPTMSGPTSNTVCEGTNICFNINTNDQQFIPAPPASTPPPDTVTLTWNQGIPGATFNIIDTTARLQQGRFCWTPKIGQASTLPYVFTATAKDNACPINASVTKAFKVLVKKLAQAERQYTILQCGKVRFHAVPENNQVNYFLWTIRDSTNTLINTTKANKVTTNRQTDTIQFKKGGKYIIVLQVNNVGNCPYLYQDTIIVPALLEVDLALGKDTFVCAGKPITLFAKVTNGYSPFRYRWTSASVNDTINTYTFTPAADSTATVRVTDANGCQAFDTILVKYINLPVINLGPDRRICDYDSITLDAANPGKKFLWSTADTTQTLKIKSAGQYIVRVTDSLGCLSRDTMNLAVNDHVTANAGPDRELCIGDTIKIGAGGADNSGGKTSQYQWQFVLGSNRYIINGDTIKAFSNSNSSFSLTLNTTQSGVMCTDKDTMDVTVNMLPTLTRNALTDRCYNYGAINFANEQAFTPGGGVYSYAKKPGLITDGKTITTESIGIDSVTTTHMITYRYVDNKGCVSIDSTPQTVIRLPKVVAKNATFCRNAGKQNLKNLLIAPVIITGVQEWKCLNQPSAVTLEGSNYMFDPTNQVAPYTYTLAYEYTDGNNCTNRDTISISVIDVPVIKFLQQPGPYCMDDGSIDLSPAAAVDPTGGYWSCPQKPNLVQNQAFLNTALDSGTYYFKYLHDASGCVVIDSIQITINPLPKVISTVPAAKQTVCRSDAPFQVIGWPAGGTFSSTITGLISPQGMVDPSKKPNDLLQTGQYNITYDYTNPNTGCSGSHTTSVRIQEPPTVSASSDPTDLCEGNSFKAVTADHTYTNGLTWSTGGDGTFPGGSNTDSVTYSPGPGDVNAGTATLTVTTNAFGVCPTTSANVTVSIWPKPIATFTGIDTFGCAPLSTQFTLNLIRPANGVSYEWDFGDLNSGTDNYSTEKDPTHFYKFEGSFTVKVLLKTDKNCDSTFIRNQYINVYPVPTAKFDVEPSTHYSTIALPKFTFINKSSVSNGSGLNYAWDFGVPTKDDDTSSVKNPVYFYGNSQSDTGQYIVTLIVVTKDGCSDIYIDSVRIGPDLTVFIPNAFSPNGYGEDRNNRFYVTAQGFAAFEINIFNRWGEKLYTSKNIEDGWDGRYQRQDCEQGVYVYQVNVTGFNGKVYKYNGTITLLR